MFGYIGIERVYCCQKRTQEEIKFVRAGWCFGRYALSEQYVGRAARTAAYPPSRGPSPDHLAEGKAFLLFDGQHPLPLVGINNLLDFALNKRLQVGGTDGVDFDGIAAAPAAAVSRDLGGPSGEIPLRDLLLRYGYPAKLHAHAKVLGQGALGNLVDESARRVMVAEVESPDQLAG